MKTFKESLLQMAVETTGDLEAAKENAAKYKSIGDEICSDEDAIDFCQASYNALFGGIAGETMVRLMLTCLINGVAIGMEMEKQ